MVKWSNPRVVRFVSDQSLSECSLFNSVQSRDFSLMTLAGALVLGDDRDDEVTFSRLLPPRQASYLLEKTQL